MKINVSAKKWQTATSRRSWTKLASHISSHYPKDSALHTALRGMFKSTDAAVMRYGTGMKKKPSAAKRRPAKRRSTAKRAPAKRRAAAKRRAPAKRRATAKRRAPARRRTAARKAAPKRRTAMRRGTRRTTARRKRA